MLPKELQIPYPKDSSVPVQVSAEGVSADTLVLPPLRKLSVGDYFKNKGFLFLWLTAFFVSFVFFVIQFFDTRKKAETIFIYEKSFYVDTYKYFKDRVWYAFDIGITELDWHAVIVGGIGILLLVFGYTIFFLFKKRKQVSILKAVFFCFFQLTISVMFLTLFLVVTVVGTVESLVQSQHAKVASYETVLLNNPTEVSDIKVITNIVAESSSPIPVFDNDTSFLFRGKEGKLSFVEAYAIPFALSGLNEKLEEIYKQADVPYLFFPNKGMLVVDQKKFLTDLGYIFAEKYLTNTFTAHQRPVVKTYKVLDGDEYKPFYVKAEIDRLEEYIAENKNTYNANLEVIKERASILSGIPARLAYEDGQYKLYVLDKQDEYAKRCSQDSLLNGCQGLLKAIERDRNIIRENKDSIERDRQDAIENIENGKKFNKDIEIYNADTRNIIANLQKGNIEDKIAESQSENAAGNFFTPQTIILRYFGDELSMSTKEYIEIINHEILHYYSDIPGKEEVLPSFVNEGLTEYFSTVSFGYEGKEFYDSLSYPLEVRVVQLLLRKIPLEDMHKVYFNQDIVLFKFLFKQYFIDVSYDNFESLGTEMTKASWLSDEYIEDYDNDPLFLQIKALLFPEETSIIETN